MELKELNAPIWDRLSNKEKNEFEEFTKIWIPKKDYKKVNFENYLNYCRFNSDNPDQRMSYYIKMIRHIKKLILEIENKALEEQTKVMDLLMKNLQKK